MVNYSEDDIHAKIGHAHLRTTQQVATESTLQTLETLYHELVLEYQGISFSEIATSAEEASLVNIASILLNIDFALTK